MHAVAQRFAWELPHAAQSTRPCRAHHRVDRLIRHVRQLLPRHLHTCTAPCSCMRSEPTLRYGTRHRSTACAPGAWHLQSRVYDAQRKSASRMAREKPARPSICRLARWAVRSLLTSDHAIAASAAAVPRARTTVGCKSLLVAMTPTTWVARLRDSPHVEKSSGLPAVSVTSPPAYRCIGCAAWTHRVAARMHHGVARSARSARVESSGAESGGTPHFWPRLEPMPRAAIRPGRSGRSSRVWSAPRSQPCQPQGAEGRG